MTYLRKWRSGGSTAVAQHESSRTFRELADDFISSRTVKRVEPGTIRFYTFALKRFLEWVDVSGARPEDFGPRELRAFLTFLDKEGKRKGSRGEAP